MDTYAILFEARQARQTELYNNWNFTSTKFWDSLTDDSFWYADDTVMLFTTETYKIGSQLCESVVLELEPFKHVRKHQNYTDTWFGIIPHNPTDLVDVGVNWAPYHDVNVDEKVRLRIGEFNSSEESPDMVVQMSFNFVELEFIYSYVEIMDVLAKIGGIQASLLPLLRSSAPFLTLLFCLQLSHIIRTKSRHLYVN